MIRRGYTRCTRCEGRGKLTSRSVPCEACRGAGEVPATTDWSAIEARVLAWLR